MLLTKSWKLLKETYNSIWEFNIGLHGAAIAFYAIFSTAPLVIIMVWVLSAILGSQMGETEFQKTLHSIFGHQVTAAINEVTVSTASGSSGFWSSLIAIIMLLFGATTLLSQIKQTLNVIWGISNPRIGTIWQFLWDRLIGLLFIGVLSLLLLAGLISESILYGLETVMMPILGSDNIFFIQMGSSLLNVVLAITFFTAMFRILPDLDVRLRDVFVGAAVTTILVLAGKALVDWYLGSAALHPTYKAAGSFVIFLIWIYYNVQVVLIGAIFTRIYTVHHGGDIEPYWGATIDKGAQP